MKTAEEIRQDFLSFFESKGHKVVHSSPVILKDDPSLLFTNAGMNQFKKLFLNEQSAKDTRICNTQKCIRVSGKHNDLEEVGKDGYHHTFFEMLGNWSFGDYYKKEAIEFTWELLTKIWKLDKERLYITVYNEDKEAYNLWQKYTDINPKHIFFFGEKDNFWEMGETGPCGPCSEVHYDRTENKDGAKLINTNSEEVIEIWNLVFIQYNRKNDGSLEELKSKHIDTGMGFERIVSILQGKKNNYETDIFTELIKDIGLISKKNYQDNPIAFQVVADHIRMIAFAIADGSLPSNTGRGYVVRRVIRRASLFMHKLGLNAPALYKLIPALKKTYAKIFPELSKQDEHICSILKSEETLFLKTLDRGLTIFTEATHNSKVGDELGTELVFKLYDTYGFPIDLTKQLAEEKKLVFDEKKYLQRLNQAKNLSRQNQKSINTNDWQEIIKGTSSFVGYEKKKVKTQILRYRKIESTNKETYEIVLKDNPFYAESGGQVGDQGLIENEYFQALVYDTKKIDDESICFVQIETGQLKNYKGELIVASINDNRRSNLRKNHTATHLLHQALIDTLGTHIEQRGSLVKDTQIRFDFSHFEPISPSILEKIEFIVNQKILQNSPVTTQEQDLEKAKKSGAKALFGEKYTKKVRIVSIGNYSIELCGGTHVKQTGEIGLFKITAETSISAGIRRIEAITGLKSLQVFNQTSNILKNLAKLAKSKIDSSLLEKILNIQEKYKKLQKENQFLQNKINKQLIVKLKKSFQLVKNKYLLVEVFEQSDLQNLKNLAFQLINTYNNAIVVLLGKKEGKVFLVTAVSPLLNKKYSAQHLLISLNPLLKGTGGGSSKIAQASGTQYIEKEKLLSYTLKIL